jgi:hypothetical protein
MQVIHRIHFVGPRKSRFIERRKEGQNSHSSGSVNNCQFRTGGAPAQMLQRAFIR